MCFFGLNTWWLCFGLIWFFWPCTVFAVIVCYLLHSFQYTALVLIVLYFCVCFFLCASSFALAISSFTYYIVELFLVYFIFCIVAARYAWRKSKDSNCFDLRNNFCIFGHCMEYSGEQISRFFSVGYAMNSEEMMTNKSIGWRSFYALLSKSCLLLMVQGVRSKI